MIPRYFETTNDIRIAAAIQAKLMQGILRPSTKRGLLVRLIMGLWFCLAVLTPLIITISHSGTPTVTPDIAYQFLPGHSLPKAASCEEDDVGSRFMWHCAASQDSLGLVHYTYDQWGQVIRRASAAVDGITIGDLILTWGTPDSYRCGYGNIQVYWGEKSAFVSAPLRPNSQVKVILYYLKLSDMPIIRLDWRGLSLF